MDEAKIEEVKLGRRSPEDKSIFVGQKTHHEEIHFPYTTTDTNTRIQAVSTTDAHFLQTEPSLPQYGIHLANDADNLQIGSCEDTPVLLTRGGSTTKGPKGALVCNVEGCEKDLSLEKKYYKRYRVCMEHLKMNAIYVDGELQRFCQQCGRFHDLHKFDGDKRNCRERLSQHNIRRRKSKRQPNSSDGSCEDWGYDHHHQQQQPYDKIHKGRRSQRLMRKGNRGSALWTNNSRSHHSHYVQSGGHGIASSEGHKDGGHHGKMEILDTRSGSATMAINSLGNDTSLSSYSPQFTEDMGLNGQPEGTGIHDTNHQERESLYNMVVHQILPPSTPQTTTDLSTNGRVDFHQQQSYPHHYPSDLPVSRAQDALSNFTTYLQFSDPSTTTTTTQAMAGSSTAKDVPPSTTGLDESATNNFPLLGGVGMLQSLCVSSPGGNVPAVPMFLFPTSSGGNQVNAVAIIPTAISSCPTILPFSCMSQDRSQTFSIPIQSTDHVESSPVSIPTSDPCPSFGIGNKEQSHQLQESLSSCSGEIPSIVNFALSPSGLSQLAASSNAFQSAIRPDQLAQFQTLIARHMSMCQGADVPINSQSPIIDSTDRAKKENEKKATT